MNQNPHPHCLVILVVETGSPHHVIPGNEKGHAGIRQGKGTESAGWMGGYFRQEVKV